MLAVVLSRVEIQYLVKKEIMSLLLANYASSFSLNIISSGEQIE